MKTLLTLLLSLFISNIALAQEKPTAVVGQSLLTKKDKLVQSIMLGKKKFNIYLSEKIANEEGTYQLYKIVENKRKLSELEFPKQAIRNGKITAEGSYKITNNTLVIINDSYDYIGAYRITEVYVLGKYGLKMTSDKMVAIDTDKLPDNYLKSAEMKQPVPAKN